MEGSCYDEEKNAYKEKRWIIAILERAGVGRGAACAYDAKRLKSFSANLSGF